ncbi:hypothetical protein AAHZ94_25620 [Streptomyces sp. HSW2009]|uniref:hypothetical protein n=1 Tax=Streptomyces sp. HSW2009 TaxID=3142890 RepID=UPI0032EE1019
MRAEYYVADSADGDHIDDPSEDALYLLFGDLNATDNRIVHIRPVAGAATWQVSVTLRGPGRYEVVRRDAARGEHAADVVTDIGHLAQDLTRWLAARDTPGPRPGRAGGVS